MNKVIKLLTALTIMVFICSNFSLIAYAGTTASQPTAQTEDTAATDATQDTPALSEDYFVDEQGQVIYDASVLNNDTTVTDESTDTTDSTSEDVEVTEDTDSKVTDSEDTDATVKEDTQSSDNKDKKEKEPTYSKSDLRLLSALVYSESGNQPYATMLGVANVVLNRVDSKAYWHVNTIKEVIYDNKWSIQFAVTIKNSKGISPMDKALKLYDSGDYNSNMKKAIKAAKDALNGKNNIGSYLCFSNKNYISYVKKHYSKYRIIGDMIFYRSK